MEKQKTLVCIFILVLFLAVTKLLFSNALSTAGLRLAALKEESCRLKKEENLLSEEILKLSSLSRISLEAKRLGFTKPSLVVNLVPEVPVALK